MWFPKYLQFLDRYPSLQELALAPVNQVKQIWYPLGYNIRPERLHSIACETVERYGGILPNDHEQLLSFKGIGRYTAGAIRSFAFNEDAPILDTNVMRVLHRVFIGRGNPLKQKVRLWKLAEALIPPGRGYDFNQAIMDFGALCCTARTPSCQGCTMKPICRTFPFTPRGKGLMTNVVEVAAGLIADEGRYLIAKRRTGVHLAGLWEFPGGKREPGETLEECLQRELFEELSIRIDGPIPFRIIRHEYPEKIGRTAFLSVHYR